MRPALWKAVADNLKESHPDLKLVAKDDFNATLRAKGSTARLGLFYQPREGDVPGEGHASLTLDGRSEMGAIAYFLAEQATLAKELAQPIHFQQTIDDARAESLGAARISLQATVVSRHGDELVDRISVWYANAARSLLRLHGRIIVHRDA
jgi:hypothetical protein